MRNSIPRLLEISASARVLRERRLRALASAANGAVLGRTFVTLRGLAEHCAAETDVAISGWLDDAAVARVVQGCAGASHPLGRLIDERPGLARALASTLRDLRDAGVPPEALPDGARELRRVYAATERALRELGERGLVDRVGLFRLAARGARAWVERLGFEAAEIHGATELVGSAGDLIERLAVAVPLRMLQPDCGEDFARELRASWPWRFVPEPVAVVADPVVARGPAAIRRLRARGPREELEMVAREILQLLDTGVDAEDVAVVARELAPYAPWIESVFGRFGIPYSSSLAEPVLRWPAVRAWLDLAQALFGDVERGAVLRLLCSPRLELADRHALTELAEWLSRRAAVVRGDDWSSAFHDAEQLAARDRRHSEPRRIETLCRILDALRRDGRSVRAARGFRECAERFLNVGDRLFGAAGDDSAADELARAAVASSARLDEVDAVTGRPAQPGPEELRAAIEQALHAASWRPSSEDNGGVRILDALQARALPLPHLFLVGLHHGAWPRPRREDPFLSDELRLALRRATGRPVPAAQLAEREERSLFELLQSQASQSLVLVRPTEDSWGRQLGASALLLGPASATPELAADELADRELLTPTEALIRSALECGPSERSRIMRALAREHLPGAEAGLLASLRHLEATDAPAGAELAYDGVIPDETRPTLETVSPSFLETLGNCPLKAFFQRILGVSELEVPPPNGLGAAEAGTLVHALLAHLYRRLFDEGALRPGTPPERARERARQLLPEAIAASTLELRRSLRDTHPALWTALEEQVGAAALDFVDRDLGLLLPAGVSELRAEEELRFSLAGDGEKLDVSGRVDRIVRSAAGTLRVGDYKTSRDPGVFVRQPEVERGTALQVPLYTLAAASAFDTSTVIGEILSVPLRPERDPRGERGRERQLDLEAVEESTPRPLSVLRELLRDGHFPFRAHDGCRYCAYAVACRKGHPASARRVAEFEGFARYFELHGGTP
ncbi:MAG: PD-(D/E)XK nuclease family protein [Myxococcota bacterium]